ncbi:MAG TPA: alpha/beta fold hydrolase [Jiangellaceae bacterium]|nr:alpha/beta fold hydrolase [Jiangellaceae bacterium]
MTTTRAAPSVPEEIADHATPLDALLVDAALGPLRRFVPDASTARFAAGLVSRPRTSAQRVRDLAGELARIGAGTSRVAPSRRDRRFADPGWVENPVLRRLVQGYLATEQTAAQLVGDAGLGSRDQQRVRFFVENLLQAMSPSNIPLVNPASAKAVVDTAGLSLLRGGINLLRDLATAPRVPQMVDRSSFQVGRNIAVTPGAVVLRNDLFELIQYRPQTDQVRAVPLLIAPPTINKYYALDLSPGRSLVEHLVAHGQQVFVISWRNLDARYADRGMDDYVQAVLDALDAMQRICGSDRAAIFGFCSGGIIASLAAVHLAGTGQLNRLAALGLGVTVLDFADAGVAGALVDRRLAEAAKAKSKRRGYLDGRALAEVFAWLRPADLVWNYWVNNYLLGKKPPAFDILFWNADTTRMSSELHADFVDLAINNELVRPGATTARGVQVDLSRVTVDTYVVAGITDHLTPWQSCYRSTQLLGGESRFVLSSSGHIAALVNPPGNPKASYLTSKENPADPQAWLKGAETRQDSWWPDAVAWFGERCGPEKPAPDQLGGGGLRPLVDAPGTYVFDT